MKRYLKSTYVALFAMFAFIFLMADSCAPTSDDIQRRQQETHLKEGTAQTGLPAIVNFRERKLLKYIYELRDQDGLVTYTYLENLTPGVVPGHTALGGKLTYVGESIGYGIPYATQYTNPQKPITEATSQASIIAQADPNGLYSPASADGTWILLLDPKTNKPVPVYMEPRIIVSPFPFKLD
jgi:hypothetical protein